MVSLERIDSLDDLHFDPDFVGSEWYDRIYNEVSDLLKQGQVNLRGTMINEPRKKIIMCRASSKFYKSGAGYQYSGVDHDLVPFTKYVRRLYKKIMCDFGIRADVCIVNYYHDGSQHISWHGDLEMSIRKDTPIFTVSLGETRTFTLRNRYDHTETKDFVMTDGSMLIMPGGDCQFQRNYEHTIRKTVKKAEPRISLTFRQFPHSNETRVCNKYKDDFDVYIGRPSKWGNPFPLNDTNDMKARDEVIQKYEKYIRSKPELLKQVEELKGKRLSCVCFPKPCHGDILVKLVKEKVWESYKK